MKDYRYFPLSQYYPIGTSRLFNGIYECPNFENPGIERPVDSVFRGEVMKQNENYSFQRNKVIELFENDKYPNLITGDIISKKKYLKEMKQSKTCVSPFGWGEICYRDFEAVLNGTLLIKPDMDHLETYPDIYIKDETYVPLRWDMEDQEETLHNVLNHYEKYLPYIHKAQKIYKKALNNPNRFINHLMDIFDLH